MNDITGLGAVNYTNTSIWPGGTVPGTGNQAVIDKGDGISDYVYVDSQLQIQRFNIGNQNTGGLELRSGAYLFLSQGGNQVNVGPSGAPVGSLPGVGYLRIKSGATLEQSGLMNLGLNPTGTGTITLEDGGTHIVGTNVVNAGGGTGTYNMLGGSLTTGGYVLMGNAVTGNGTFKQSGGTLQINRTSTTAQGLFLGFVSGATGLYEVSGGTLNVAATNAGVLNGANAVGGGGLGTFRIVGSAPTITIGTNYDQRANASLEVVIGATGISPMNLGGNAILDGILGASFTATPSVGQQFTIMNYAGTLTGAFATFDSLVDSPLGPNTVQLSLAYGTGTASSLVLTVDSLVASLPGDFNGNGKVDAADYVVWRKNPAGNGGTPGGYNTWRANFGSGSGAGSLSAAAVPEPSMMLLVVSAAACAVGARRKRIATIE